MAEKQPKTAYQKSKERKALKEKALTEETQLSDFSALKERHSQAMATHDKISGYAYGKTPETVEMPSEVRGTHLGGQFTTPRELPTGNEEASRVPLSELLSFKNEGVNTADPKDIVRRGWESPPPVPSSAGSFMGHAATNRVTPATDQKLAKLASSRLGELSGDTSFEKFRQNSNVTPKSSIPEVMEGLVSTRTSKFSGNPVDWYEGERTGTTSEGFPKYRQGASPAMMGTLAANRNLSPSAVRRASAMVSPQAAWSVETPSGMEYPNAEAAAQGLSLGKTTSRSPEDIGTEVASNVGHGTLPANIAKAVKQGRGELSNEWEPIRPPRSNEKGIATAKQTNFDLGLTNPYSDKYGYSPLIAHEKSKAYTSDTHDIGVAGVKTGVIPTLNPKTGKQLIDPSTGKGKTSNPAEKWLSSAGGQDMSIASAQIATADLFNEHYGFVKDIHGHEKAESWAEQNAHHYAPNNAQAAWWVGERD